MSAGPSFHQSTDKYEEIIQNEIDNLRTYGERLLKTNAEQEQVIRDLIDILNYNILEVAEKGGNKEGTTKCKVVEEEVNNKKGQA